MFFFSPPLNFPAFKRKGLIGHLLGSMVFEFLAAQKQAKAAKAPTAHLIPGAKPVSQEEFKVWLAQHTPIALMSRLFLCVPR